MATTTAQAAERQRAAEGSVRETVESIIIAFVLAFVFRAFVVEAFVIPTGSMAPTLLGQHDHVFCPMCGYRFAIGPPTPTRGAERDEAFCPMCEYALSASKLGPESGDRILVLKYVYTFSEPQRWDVVVFKNPSEPEENYIKRLVGLPGEQLMIAGGNIYTRPLVLRGEDLLPPVDDEGRDPAERWQIARKPPHVQRAVWQPVYHSRYYPLDADERRWQMPWQPLDPAGWDLDEHGPHYHYSAPGGAPGTLAFRFDDRSAHDFFQYNLWNVEASDGDSQISEMRLAATVIPEAAGLRVVMETSGLLPGEGYRAVYEADGTLLLQAQQGESAAGAWQTLAQVAAEPLPPGRAAALEFWHADQQLSVWMDGRLMLSHAYDRELRDPDVKDAVRRADSPPLARLTVQGPAVTIREMELDRDLHYTQGDNGDNGFGSMKTPAIIPADRFFVLGDNSPSSADSRLWTHTDEWVDFYTAPEIGLVPRELMIGRAFFVYFPAPLPLVEGRMNFIPNFGKMRFIH